MITYDDHIRHCAGWQRALLDNHLQSMNCATWLFGQQLAAQFSDVKGYIPMKDGRAGIPLDIDAWAKRKRLTPQTVRRYLKTLIDTGWLIKQPADEHGPTLYGLSDNQESVEMREWTDQSAETLKESLEAQPDYVEMIHTETFAGYNPVAFA